MSRTLAISNNKGGVNKTTATVELAASLSLHGNKVLIVDTDNQGNVALSFGISPDVYDTTIYDVLIDDSPVRDAVYNVYDNIDILPANDTFQFFEFDVLTDIEHYRDPFILLRDHIKKLEAEYDYILLDTPPNLGLVQGNVLTYAKEIIIPFQPEKYAMRSLVKTLQAIHDFKEKRNPELQVLGVLGTMVDQRTVLHSDIIQKARAYCYENNIPMFNTVIPRKIRYASSIAYEGIPAVLSGKDTDIKENYNQLRQELEKGE